MHHAKDDDGRMKWGLCEENSDMWRELRQEFKVYLIIRRIKEHRIRKSHHLAGLPPRGVHFFVLSEGETRKEKVCNWWTWNSIEYSSLETKRRRERKKEEEKKIFVKNPTVCSECSWGKELGGGSWDNFLWMERRKMCVFIVPRSFGRIFSTSDLKDSSIESGYTVTMPSIDLIDNRTA